MSQQYSDLIKQLQSKIQTLADENRLLKQRMDEAGISYADIVNDNDETTAELYDLDQGARIKRFEVTDKVANDLFMMFCRGRKDVYDLRYTNPKNGKNGYYTQCFNRWDNSCHKQKKDGVLCKDCELKAYKPITIPLIKNHINGMDSSGREVVVAIYPMLENNLCQLMVFDFDNHAKGAESVNLKSFKYYDRMIPTQDALPEGGLGNVIALPLQGMALKAGNSAFVDENWNAYEDQLKLLAGTKRLTRQEIEDYLSLWYSSGTTDEDDANETPWDKNSEIEVGSVKGVVHIVLADRIYIDSTGITNKAKRQLRRMATFSNKQYFQNQAMDMPNYDESRFIYLGSDEGKYIVLPRGLRERILNEFDKAGIKYKDGEAVPGRRS